ELRNLDNLPIPNFPKSVEFATFVNDITHLAKFKAVKNLRPQPKYEQVIPPTAYSWYIGKFYILSHSPFIHHTFIQLLRGYRKRARPHRPKGPLPPQGELRLGKR